MANTAATSDDSPTVSSTAGAHETLTSTPTPPDTRGKAKRQTIPVACTACQRRKSKCDGKRPACSICRKKTTTCTYDVEAGETRVHALRKKNDALAFDMATMSSVLTLMREKPFAEAEEIFRRVRSAQDIASLLANFDERPPTMPKNESSEGMRSMLSHSTSSRTDPSASPSLEHQLSAISRKRSTPEIDPPSSTLSLIAAQPLPDEDKLRQAVDAFFAGAGKLFHVFSHQQGMLLFDNVYRPADNKRDNAAICELTALGALGWCYGHEGLPPGDGDVYYSFARYHLEDSIDADTLRGMRSCALIAMYNIMDKSTVALAYIELGLSMARQRGLHGKVRPLEMAREEWIDCKRVWRTLTFLASWLSASIGIVSDADKPVNDALEELAVEDHSDFDDLIQTKIAEISVITASMLRTVYGFDRLSPRAARMMIDDLERWYLKLPPSMELERLLYSPNIVGTHTTRGPALFVHLLYFGALLMLFRRIVAQAHYTAHLSSGQSWLENKPDTSLCLEKGIHAAVQSAQILDALNTRFGLFKHCWLVICQSYCSCAILLYAAAQRKARYHYDSSAADYILEAEKCLAVLHYCGQADFVARNYHTTLRAHYDKLAVLMLVSLTDRRAHQAVGNNSISTPQPTQLYEQITYIQKEQQRSAESRQPHMAVSPLQLADIMLDVPQGGAQGLHTVAHALQELLRRPYGGEVVESMRGSTSRPPPTQPNDLFSSIPMLPSIIEKPDWRFEVCSPFNWTSPHLVPLDERETVATETMERLNRNYFVASDGLAGWTGSADKRRRVDLDALD